MRLAEQGMDNAYIAYFWFRRVTSEWRRHNYKLHIIGVTIHHSSTQRSGQVCGTIALRDGGLPAGGQAVSQQLRGGRLERAGLEQCGVSMHDREHPVGEGRGQLLGPLAQVGPVRGHVVPALDAEVAVLERRLEGGVAGQRRLSERRLAHQEGVVEPLRRLLPEKAADVLGRPLVGPLGRALQVVDPGDEVLRRAGARGEVAVAGPAAHEVGLRGEHLRALISHDCVDCVELLDTGLW